LIGFDKFGSIHRSFPRQPGPFDILGRPDAGMKLLRSHFARCRPLVAATSPGVAAIHDTVAAQLGERWSAGIIRKPRDNALIALGRAYVQINAARGGMGAAPRPLAQEEDHRVDA
jgi:hypothetical protein